MSKPAPAKKPIHIEKAQGVDRDAFANKMADYVVEQVRQYRKRKGLPPLIEDLPSKADGGSK